MYFLKLHVERDIIEVRSYVEREHVTRHVGVPYTTEMHGTNFFLHMYSYSDSSIELGYRNITLPSACERGVDRKMDSDELSPAERWQAFTQLAESCPELSNQILFREV